MKNSVIFGLITFPIAFILMVSDTIGFVAFIILAFILLIIIAIMSNIETSETNENYKSKVKIVLENLKDFKADDYTLSNMSAMSIAFDNQRKKICFIDAVYKPWIYEYDKIIESEIVIDGQTIIKKSGTIGRSIIGGVLAGGAGAIIGGTTGSTTSDEKINSILVKITINNTINPVFKVIFLNTSTQKRSFQYNIAFSEAEKIHGIISGLIKQVDLDLVKTPYNNLNIADELVKLKKLLDEGILTNDEFDNQKKKLLVNQ